MDGSSICPSIWLKDHFDQSKDWNLLILSTVISQRYAVVCWALWQSKICSVGELAMNTFQGRGRVAWLWGGSKEASEGSEGERGPCSCGVISFDANALFLHIQDILLIHQPTRQPRARTCKRPRNCSPFGKGTREQLLPSLWEPSYVSSLKTSPHQLSSSVGRWR